MVLTTPKKRTIMRMAAQYRKRGKAPKEALKQAWADYNKGHRY